MPSATKIILDNTIKSLSDNDKYKTIWFLISELQKYDYISFRELNILIKKNLEG